MKAYRIGMELDHYETLLLDIIQRDVGTTRSEPAWTINDRTFLRNSKIRISVTIPPIQPVYSNAGGSSNNTFKFTIGATTYTVTIDAGFYEDANDVVNIFNTAFLTDADPVVQAMVFALDSHTAKITARHGASDFTVAETSTLLGFVLNQASAALSLVATDVCQVGDNSIFFCSDLEALLYHHSAATQRESFLPDELFLTSTLPVISAYHHVQSAWINVLNTTSVSSVSFHFARPADPDTAVTIEHDWAVIIDVAKAV